MTDDLDLMFDTAHQRGKERLANEPRAVLVRYDPANAMLRITLSNGCDLGIPTGLIEGLSDADHAIKAEVEISGVGYGLTWPALDLDISVPGLLSGVFGTKAWMDRLRAARAGSSASAAKSAAARSNGAKGGRPRKAAAL